MNDNNLKQMQKCFNITESEVLELIANKDHQSQFVLYVTAQDHRDSALYTFAQLDYDLHTRVDEIRGYTCPYDVLLHNSTFGRDEKQLFHFIVNRLCRDIMDKNITLL